MNENGKMLESLGLYLLQAKGSGKTLEDCKAAIDDYHDFLRPFEKQAENIANVFGFGATNPLIPLDDISWDFNIYCSIADQIFSGVTQLNALYLPYPRPAAVEAAEKAKQEAQSCYLQNYLATRSLKGDTRTPHDVNAIMERINELLMAHIDQRVRGLVVGRVQSGKTRNYVGLMLKAIDEGWNVIIVLTSCNTTLADQTEERIQKDFKESGLRHGRDYLWQSFRTQQPPPPEALDDGNYAYVGVAMKQVENLNRIISWLDANKECLPQMRVLLVDDESDNATPDSSQVRDNRLTEDEMDELKAAIDDAASNEDPAFKELADWMELICSDGEFSDEEGMPNARVVGELKRALAQRNKATFDEILGNEDFKRVLELEQYEVDGNTIDVPILIRRYFNGQRRSHRAPPYFLRFLNGLLDVAATRSAINHRVCTIVGKSEQTGKYNFDFGRFAYVAYTATPYANMFNERSDQTPLYPDFIYSLHEAPQYFGLEQIFGDEISTIAPRMNIVREIPCCDGDTPPRDEVRFVLRPRQKIKDQQVIPNRVLPVEGPDEDMHVTCRFQNAEWDGEWASLKEALAWFFCSAAAHRWHRLTKYAVAVRQDATLPETEKTRKINELDRRWTTMLVNISQKREIHRDSKEVIDTYLKRMCAPDRREAFIDYCRTCWTKMCSTFGKDRFDSLFNVGRDADKYGVIDGYPAWDEIVEHLQYFICGLDDVTVHSVVINSENEESRRNQDRYYQRRARNGRWDYRNSLAEDHAWIVSGGNTISRGLTMPGLTTSYFDRVRGGVAVDTLTQMGRWFGFRPGYELYPRLWMTAETIGEMKKICVIEKFMHEKMRENFDAGHSPSDPDHYQQVYYCGRRLSGRQRQLDIKTVSPGTTATTNDISSRPDDVRAIYEAAQAFVAEMGQVFPRPREDYPFGELPLWENVPRTKVLMFLNRVKNFYPGRSKRQIEGLVNEIENFPIAWDVVIGEPGGHQERGSRFFVANEICTHVDLGKGMVKTGKPTGKHAPGQEAGGLRYDKARSDQAFYAMMTGRQLTLVDHTVLRETRGNVLTALQSEEKIHGRLPDEFEVAFHAAGADGMDLPARLNAYIEYCERNPEFQIAPCIRRCFAQGDRNRSSEYYMGTAHKLAQHDRPVLQLYFLTPPANLLQERPLLSISFYWPKHNSGPFQLATVLPPPPPPHPTPGQIGKAIGEILRNNHFPMQTNVLKDALLQRFPDENEAIYRDNVDVGQDIGGYCKFPGKWAYYSLDWAGDEDPAELVDKAVLTAVLDILRRDHNRHTTHELVSELQNEERFIGIANLNATHINALMTPEVLRLNGITYSNRPAFYRIPL